MDEYEGAKKALLASKLGPAFNAGDWRFRVTWRRRPWR